MKIAKDTIVTLDVRIADTLGRLVDRSRGPEAYLHGGYGNTLPRLEEALEGKQRGDSVTLQLKPEDAFGVRDESLVDTIPKADFPPGIKVGGQLQGHSKDGRPQVFHVVKIKGDTVHVDGNHPLAGKELKFMVKVLGVRAATAEEIAHGHAHGDGGHHH